MIEWLNSNAQNAADLIAIVKDAATTTAVLVGAWVAMRGLRAWQDQLRGTSAFERAKRLMHAALSLREGLILSRAPEAKPGELYAAMQDYTPWPALDDPGLEGHHLAALFRYRWNVHISDAYDRYTEAVREQEIFAGPGIHGVAYPLRGLANELWDSTVSYAACLRDPTSCTLSKEELANAKAVAVGNPIDDFEVRTLLAVQDLQDALRADLGTPISWWQRFRRWRSWRRELKEEPRQSA